MDPKIADKKPHVVSLALDEEKYWCACGQSKNMLFCDGSHKTTPFVPLKFKAEKAGDAYLCACKRTKTPPYCDGSHKSV